MRCGLIRFALVLVASLICGLATPARAADELHSVAEFNSGDEALQIYTYANGGKLGIIAFKSGDEQLSLGLDVRQWLHLKALIEAASENKGSPWREVGEAAETGVDNPCLVTVSSGPDRIRFTVAAQNKRTIIYELKPSDEYEFVVAITRVKHWLLTD